MPPLLAHDGLLATVEWNPGAASTAPRHMPYYWHLPLLIVAISLVYSATRFDAWSSILREAVRWGVRLTLFLFAIIAVLYLGSLI
jgi:Na+-transporting NADH:ubiquinone oxidoreductase subunit NqrB